MVPLCLPAPLDFTCHDAVLLSLCSRPQDVDAIYLVLTTLTLHAVTALRLHWPQHWQMADHGAACWRAEAPGVLARLRSVIVAGADRGGPAHSDFLSHAAKALLVIMLHALEAPSVHEESQPAADDREASSQHLSSVFGAEFRFAGRYRTASVGSVLL
jgi:hypothetical protein